MPYRGGDYGAPRGDSRNLANVPSSGRSKICTKDCPPTCPNSKIYIENLDPSTTIDDLQNHFSMIGIIGKIKQKRGYKDQWPYHIKIYTDDSGNPKGDGLIKYEDPVAAHSALEWFNDQEFKGKKLKVTIAQGIQQPVPDNSGYGEPPSYGNRGGGRGSYGGRPSHGYHGDRPSYGGRGRTSRPPFRNDQYNDRGRGRGRGGYRGGGRGGYGGGGRGGYGGGNRDDRGRSSTDNNSSNNNRGYNDRRRSRSRDRERRY